LNKVIRDGLWHSELQMAEQRLGEVKNKGEGKDRLRSKRDVELRWE
jgi:hypothetical protein